MDKVENCVSFIFGKAAQQITRRARERLAPFGITPVQFAVLAVLWEESGRSAAELCARLAMDSATITGVIDRLEDSGVIERRADDQDRRIQRLFVTKAGMKLKGPLNEQMDQLNAEVLGELGRSSEKILGGLRRVGSNNSAR